MEGKEGKVKSRSILVAVVASVVTAVVSVGLFMSIFYGTQLCGTTKSRPRETFVVQISDSPATARVEVNRPEKLILTETKRSGNVDHTVTLQDFKRELQAVKDLNRNQCYVLPVFAPFEEVVKVADGNVTVTDDMPFAETTMILAKEAIPQEVLRYAVGEHIAAMCKNIPTFWLKHSHKTEALRLKRLTIRFRLFGRTITITIE